MQRNVNPPYGLTLDEVTSLDQSPKLEREKEGYFQTVLLGQEHGSMGKSRLFPEFHP